VCGLLAEIRQATYRAHAREELTSGVLFRVRRSGKHRSARGAAGDRLRRRRPRPPTGSSASRPEPGPRPLGLLGRWFPDSVRHKTDPARRS
jgi:hypothetical protein